MRDPEVTEALKLVVLKNAMDTTLKILNFGASIFSLDLNGKTNVIVGPKHPEDYLTEAYFAEGKHFGASVGRHAGRISKGGFQIKEQKFPLFEREGVHLHGGEFGFTYKFWEIQEVGEGQDPFVVLRYFSPDGEEGYPGNLWVQVKYTLTQDNVVLIQYSAGTDKETIVNLTNHAYFNLNGEGSINNHQLKIPANKVLETDSQNVPTGRFITVEEKEADFRSIKEVGRLELDTVYSLEEHQGPILLKGDKSGISLEVETNQPAVVVYIPPSLPAQWEYNTIIGDTRPAICLETQKFPDAPHNPNFPSVRLKPGETYTNVTRWKFSLGS